MTQRLIKIIIGFAAIILFTTFALATGLFSRLLGDQKAINITDWKIYLDSGQQLEFQYPSDWSVTKEKGDIFRISPPDASATLSDMLEGTAIYGIRVMPLNASYDAFPVNLSESDIQNHLARVNSFFFQTTEMKFPGGRNVLFVFDIDHNNRSILAFERIGGTMLQIELGQNFPGTRSLSDLVAYFGIIESLRHY